MIKGSDTNFLLHRKLYGLTHATAVSEEEEADESSVGYCLVCKEAFYFFKKAQRILANVGAPASAIHVIDDYCLKAKLFIAFKIRVVYQHIAISNILDDMRSKCSESKVLHFTYEQAEREEVTDNKVYFDQISEGDNKQDRASVISMTEAMILRLKKELSHCFSLITPPATRNTLLPLILPFLIIVHKKEIVRFIHTETQDGKSVLDTHFSRSMRVLRSWVKEGNNCVTPTQAVVGLKSHSGYRTGLWGVVEHNRERLSGLVKQTHEEGEDEEETAWLAKEGCEE
ncbi:hypothetical protein PsorP6_005904 [Peronosclerospora sorghi]|uniref:Uncharacterized protein n=1 Tax=Peronosclerospora sorghi TaxID=230839 RepID=A0ACC0W7U1_9STRA|nr:hypothetical protein PsorP6_005904 [Peronosclerospora sorghi]